MNKKQIYLAATVLGALVPCYFIAGFVVENGLDLSLFLSQLFANNAASTFSSDLLLCSFIFWFFMYNDKKDKNLPHIGLFIALNLMVGLSMALPLYFYFREDAQN
jgi:hypothetical protein